MNESTALIGISEERTNVDWLHSMWKFYGRKPEFQIMRSDWPPEYFDLLAKMNPSLIEVWPNKEWTDESGQPNSMFVRLKPAGLKLLKEQPREVKRQVTIAGEKVDLRSERVHKILSVPIENLTTMARLWINRLQTEQHPSAWRAIQCTLDRILLYRGQELPLSLHDQIVAVLMTHTKPSDGNLDQNAENRSEYVVSRE